MKSGFPSSLTNAGRHFQAVTLVLREPGSAAGVSYWSLRCSGAILLLSVGLFGFQFYNPPQHVQARAGFACIRLPTTALSSAKTPCSPPLARLQWLLFLVYLVYKV